jgi:hypothetical protein
MSGESRKRRSTAIAIALLVASLAIAVCYVLASGPAFGLVFAGKMSRERFDLVFAPLVWLTENSAAAKSVLHWYWDIIISAFFAPD